MLILEQGVKNIWVVTIKWVVAIQHCMYACKLRNSHDIQFTLGCNIHRFRQPQLGLPLAMILLPERRSWPQLFFCPPMELFAHLGA